MKAEDDKSVKDADSQTLSVTVPKAWVSVIDQEKSDSNYVSRNEFLRSVIANALHIPFVPLRGADRNTASNSIEDLLSLYEATGSFAAVARHVALSPNRVRMVIAQERRRNRQTKSR